MNDFSYNPAISDAAIIKDIGTFIKQKRAEQNLTQAELSERAAMNRSTLSLINLIKILRMLDLLYVFAEFRYEPVISPMLLAKADEKMRNSAARNKNQSNTGADWPW